LASTNTNSLLQLGDLTYLEMGIDLYWSTMHSLSVPHLRHLHITLHVNTHSGTRPPSRHPHLRTLSIHLHRGFYIRGTYTSLIITNPQLEYLEISGSLMHRLLSELLHPSQELTLPSGSATFPGSSLKYMRLTFPGESGYEESLSTFLLPMLSKAPHLKLDVVSRNTPPTFEGLVEQFPSQVKRYQESDKVQPLDELYERVQKDGMWE